MNRDSTYSLNSFNYLKTVLPEDMAYKPLVSHETAQDPEVSLKFVAGKIVEAMAKETAIPITVQFRAGYTHDTINAVEFAKVIEYLVVNKCGGCYQCVPEDRPISKYELLCLFEKYLCGQSFFYIKPLDKIK